MACSSLSGAVAVSIVSSQRLSGPSPENASPSDMLRTSLSFVLDDFTGISERSKMALQQTKDLLGRISGENLEYVHHFESFGAELFASLESCLEVHTMASRREKMWKVFHEQSITKLPQMWKSFLQTVDIELDPMVSQTANHKMYEEMIKAKFGVVSRKSSLATLSKDEECVVRYAAGYIPFVLLKKYHNSHSMVSASIVECLSSMAVNGDESNFLEYTRDWLVKINRGGLFEVNDVAYCLFKEIEIDFQGKLKDRLIQSESSPDASKEDLIGSVASNDDVQFYWSMVSIDIDDEVVSRDLLLEIITYWLTIRGFSVAREWMEMYKRGTVKTTKKSKPLRKSLKNKDKTHV